MPKLATTPFTDLSIRKLSAKGALRLELRDAVVHGFGIRVSPSGTKTWFVMARAGGRQKRQVLGRYPDMSLADARLKASNALSAMRGGHQAVKAPQMSYSGHLRCWLDQDQAGKKSQREVKRVMERDMLPILGSMRIDAITTGDISKALTSIRNGRHPGPHLNRLLSYTKRQFNWAVEQGQLVTNPAQSIRKPVQEASRDKVLKLAELGALWRAAKKLDYPFGPFFQLLLLTGQRRSEVAGMTWEEVDLEGATWNLPASRTKNGRPHKVPLAGTALVILEATRERLHRLGKPVRGPVLSTLDGQPISGFSKAKKRLDKSAGFSDWRIHDLRRSFATLSDEHLNASHTVIELCLNHVSGMRGGVAGIYNRAEKLVERKQLMEKWADFVTR